MPQKELKAYVVNVREAMGAYREYALPQLRERKVGAQGLIHPPLDLDGLASKYDESTWHRNAVRTKARDVVGHGWSLQPEFEGQEPPGAAAEKEALDAFFWNGAVEAIQTPALLEEPVCIPSTLSEVGERVLVDLDTIGNGYLVVVRDDRASGAPSWFAHQQGSKLRIHQDRLRFRWRSGGVTHWFKRFGLALDVHIRTGEYHPLGSLALEERAPEIVHFATYTPTDNYYGVPDVTPALGSVVMELLARDFNVKFFDNHAIPQYAVIIEGLEGELSEDTEQAIRDFFQTAKGNPHQTLVLDAPAAGPNTDRPSIRFEKLAVDVREGHFIGLREQSRNEVLAAHAVPGYRLGLAIEGNLGGTNIREADEIYKFEEVDTRRELLEERINRLIIRQGFGIESWSLRLGQIDVSDFPREVQTWEGLVSRGIVTPNEARAALGLERVENRPELDEFYSGGRLLGDMTPRSPAELQGEREALLQQILQSNREN